MPTDEPDPPTAGTEAAPLTDPDQTWRILGLVNEWVKHAESKAAGTLAAAGVSAGILYNLLEGVNDANRALDILAILCALCIAGGGACAAWALRPRLWSKEEPTSRLYFHHIARRHPKRTKGVEYVAELHGLTQDRQALVADLASQIWANAHVASDKFKAGGIGLALILIGIVLLGVTTAMVAWNTW